MGALRRTLARGGIRSSTVPSVARIRAPVLVKVDHTDQTVTDLAVGLAAFNIDQAFLERFKHVALEIAVHGGVDIGNEFVDVGSLEIGFGENQTQRGGSVTDGLFNAFPILRFRGELVAGDDSPLVHICLLRQKNVSGVKAELFKFLVHFVFLLRNKLPYAGKISYTLYRHKRKNAMKNEEYDDYLLS